MAKSFAAAVADWERKTLLAQTAVLHGSVRKLADTLDDKTPKVRGNLANSRTVTTGSRPTIDWRTKKFRDPSDAINNAIAGIDIGETAWLGFRAPYAHKIEPKYAMMRLTAQLWAQIVHEQATIVKGKS